MGRRETGASPRTPLSIPLAETPGHAMAVVQSHLLLAQLRNARSPTEQNAALRSLKNDTIGHIQRKERWIQLGALEPLVKTLQVEQPSSRANGKESRPPQVFPRGLTEEERVHLHALELLTIFASGPYSPSLSWPSGVGFADVTYAKAVLRF